jgi:hypothetical protein
VDIVLAICITSTNTLSTLLANEGTSIPAFQSFFNYVLLNLIYTSYTIYKYGFKRWVRLCIFEGWRFFILAFFDVEGNYFVVLAYRYVSSTPSDLYPHGDEMLTCSLDDHPKRAAHKLLGHSNRRRNLLFLLKSPLPLHANLRHPAVHWRARRHLRLRPHHRRKQLWRQRCRQGRSFCTPWRYFLRPVQRL